MSQAAENMRQDMSSLGLDRHPLLRKLAKGKVLIYRRSFLDLIHWCFFFVLSVVIIIAIYIFIPGEPSGWPFEWFIPLSILTVIIHKKYNRKYVVSAHGISFQRGILSIRKKEQALSYAKFRSAELQQSILQRILNLGDLGITTILGDQPEIKLVGIFKPRELAAVIEFFIAKMVNSFPKEGGGKLQDQIPLAHYLQTKS